MVRSSGHVLQPIMVVIKQIMPEVVILGLINAYLAYRDLMRAEGPKHIPIF